MLGLHNFCIIYINRRILWIPIFSIGLLASVVSAQNLLTNGDFEAPPYAPSSVITGWAVGGSGHIHQINEGVTSALHSAAFNIGHDSEGTTLSQSFPTIVGQLYRVDFDAGIFGQPSGNPLQVNMQIAGNGTLLNQTVVLPNAFTFIPDAVLFGHYYFKFIANSTTTTIQFMDVGLGNAIADTLVDSVAVQPEENILVNGDFETQPLDLEGNVFGWNVGGNQKISARGLQGSTGGTHAAALSTGGDSSGNILSQSFSTTVGKVYNLDFYAGIFGLPDINALPQQLEVQIIGSGPVLDQTVSPPAQGTFDPAMIRFQHYQFSFTANSALTTLQFMDIGTGNTTADVMVDTVSVAPQPLQLINGDFETGPFDLFSVTGWTISGNGRVEDNAEGSTSPTHSAAFGTGGSSQGNILSQSLNTIAGRQYSLDFDSGVFGMRTGARLQMQVQLLGDGAVLNQTITPPDAFTFNTAQMMFQHYHLVFTANTGITTLQFQDIGTGNSVADPVIDSVVVQLQSPRSFAGWQAAHFTQSQLNNPGISNWSSDPDGDGIPNGLESFFNMDPLGGIPTPDGSALPRTGIMTSGGSRYLTLTYRRPIAYRGTPEIIAVSDNASFWDETGSQVELISGPVATGDGYTETLTVRLKTAINQGPIPRKFFRLELTQ